MKTVNIKFILAFLMPLVLLVSCANLDDEITDIREEITELKNALSRLKEAYDGGKIIRSVEPIEGSNNWLITFSDNTTIEILSGRNGQNGQDGVTPIVKINENNYWCVSYDEGKTYELLLDGEGNPITAKGDDGKEGSAGQDGNSVRIVINKDGFFVIETYNTKTGDIIESIVTKYHGDPKNEIVSIVEDSSRGTITITMLSGEVYVFKQMVIYPAGIVPLTKELNIKHGESVSLEIRINPSNAIVNINELKLDVVSTQTRESVSYIKEPEGYYIDSVVPSTDDSGNIKRGQYVVTIKDNETNPDYSDYVAIVLATKDNNGAEMEISSDLISISSVYPSLLPRVYITTPDKQTITSKTVWLEGSNIRIVDENGDENLNVTTSVRGRGNSTWTYKKKPYAIKLDKKAEVLGMPKHKRWVLLANYLDRTLLRNDVAFEMGRRVMEWAPRGKFVELYLNGKHLGNYYLCEQIKVDENRVNVDELDKESDFTDSSQVTGGYILEFDTYGPTDEINYFYTTVLKYPVTIKEPDEDVITSWTHLGYLYIEKYLNDIELLLSDDKNDRARWDELNDLIDVKSYIDWWLIHELTGNREPVHPKSSYMFKKRDGKLFAGPVWDFDYGTFKDKGDSVNGSTLWYYYLLRYPEYKSALKEHWAELKDTFVDIEDYIIKQAALIEKSNETNISMWPITHVVNLDEELSFDEAVERMISEYNRRIEIVDKYISNL